MPIRKVVLSDGQEVLVEVASNEAVKKSAFKNFKFGPVAEQIKSISTDLKNAVIDAKPDKFKLEFQIDLSVETGELASVIVKADSAACFKITLEWEKDKNDEIT